MWIISTGQNPRARGRNRIADLARRAAKTACGAVLLAAVAACSAPQVRTVSGADTFDTHCSACHGARGEGDGPDAARLSVPVPNLRLLSRRYGGAFPEDALARYIDGSVLPAAHAGERNMPVWGPVFDTTSRLISGAAAADERIDDLIAYLRGIQE